MIKAGLVDLTRPIIVDIKVGSSEGGASPNPGSHHPERSNVVRTFAPYGHRHTAEVIQELSLTDVHLTMASVDPDSGPLVCLAAIDNLMKGASGSAVQAMNVMCGFEETSGLGFTGLHPI